MADAAQQSDAIQAVEFAAYRLGGAILLGMLRMDDAAAWAAHGYLIGRQDKDGPHSVREGPTWEIKIRRTEHGCALEYHGERSVEVYEEFVSRAIRRGYVFATGKRKPPEDFFVMDTLASETGAVGIMGMARTLVDNPTMFSVSLFRGQGTRH